MNPLHLQLQIIQTKTIPQVSYALYRCMEESCTVKEDIALALMQSHEPSKNTIPPRFVHAKI